MDEMDEMDEDAVVHVQSGCCDSGTKLPKNSITPPPHFHLHPHAAASSHSVHVHPPTTARAVATARSGGGGDAGAAARFAASRGRRSVNEEGEAADVASCQRLARSAGREKNLGATKLLQTNSAGGPCPITARNKRGRGTTQAAVAPERWSP